MQGTRIAVDLLLELVDAGLSVDDILKEYPSLKRGDVLMVVQVGPKVMRPFDTKGSVEERP